MRLVYTLVKNHRLVVPQVRAYVQVRRGGIPGHNRLTVVAELVSKLVYNDDRKTLVASERNADAQHVLPIVALVQRKVAESGLGLREFAEVRGIRYGTLQRLHNSDLPALRQGLKPATLKALALGLDVPLSEVQRAADASVDRVYRQPVGVDITVLLGSLEALPPQERQRVAKEIVESVADYLTEPGSRKRPRK